jgi:ketosteroid isomerase-like protein
VAVTLGLMALGSWAAHPADAPRALLGADAARAQAMVAGDLAALDRALGDDLSYGHSNGVLEDKGALLESIRSGTRRYRSLTPREASARLYGDTGIVVALADAEVDAQGQSRALVLRYTATYVRRQERWVLVAYQSTAVPPAAPAQAPGPIRPANREVQP